KLISGETKKPYLGIVLQYDPVKEIAKKIDLGAKPSNKAAKVRVGMIGAGDYARGMLLPKFKANDVAFASIATASGLTARNVGQQFGFESCVSDADEVLKDESTNLIVIATRHDSHATLAGRALALGKHVFVEKPLAMNDAELDKIIAAASNSSGGLMVGFNRRFSPSAAEAKQYFADRQSPLSILYRVNSGRVPKSSWAQDPATGGGRIVGEVCHFIDLMHFLTDSVTTRVYAEAITSRNHEITDADSVFITLKFADGSNGTIAYLAAGDKSMNKERIEIFGDGKVFVIDDFRQVSMFAAGKETVRKFKSQDKGQSEEIRVVCSVVTDGGEAPISLEDLAATTRATFRICESLKSGQALGV